MEPMKKRLLSGILAGLTLLSCGPVPALAVSGGGKPYVPTILPTRRNAAT